MLQGYSGSVSTTHCIWEKLVLAKAMIVSLVWIALLEQVGDKL